MCAANILFLTFFLEKKHVDAQLKIELPMSLPPLTYSWIPHIHTCVHMETVAHSFAFAVKKGKQYAMVTTEMQITQCTNQTAWLAWRNRNNNQVGP